MLLYHSVTSSVQIANIIADYPDYLSPEAAVAVENRANLKCIPEVGCFP